MPIIAVQTALQVGITFGLQEIVVMTFLGEEVHIVVLTVVPNLFHHSPDSGFVFTYKLRVLGLLVPEDFDKTPFFGKGALQLGNPSGYVWC
jgi:hypothetical protein